MVSASFWLTTSTLLQYIHTYRFWTHHGGCSSCCLSSCCLVDLVLGSFDLSLQVCRGVEIFALFPGASPFDVIHADGHCVVVGINHCTVGRVSEPAIVFSSITIAALIFSTYLQQHRDANNVIFEWWNGKKLGFVCGCDLDQFLQGTLKRI